MMSVREALQDFEMLQLPLNGVNHGLRCDSLPENRRQRAMHIFTIPYLFERIRWKNGDRGDMKKGKGFTSTFI